MWFGVRNLIQFNQALLGIWLLRYDMKRKALWRLVVETKYDSFRGGWCSREVVGLFEVGVWKYIRRGENCFQDLLHTRRDGSKVRF
jgi:hypothetical protein